MSLLMHSTNPEVRSLARRVFERQFAADPRLETEYDERRKALMYNDILYNLSFLDTAAVFQDEKIFTSYSLWVYRLLVHLMKDLSPERIREHLTDHLKLLGESLGEVLPPEEVEIRRGYLESAVQRIQEVSADTLEEPGMTPDALLPWKKAYLARLLEQDTRGALQVIREAEEAGVSLEDICTGILQQVMEEVGRLWHRGEITVDREHYCTSTTQMALSLFYPRFFATARHGRKVLTCAVGGELHEMGARMLADLFEYHGWDSIFLGAAVPLDAVIHGVEESRPDLLCLSVTMPQHLSLCHDMVLEVRHRIPEVKIAVGGQAFRTTSRLWEKWPVDAYGEDAMELLEWAWRELPGKGTMR